MYSVLPNMHWGVKSVAAAVLLVAVVIVIWLVGVLVHQETSAASVECSDHNECTRDTVRADNTCRHEPYWRKQACSTCYTAGHCDGAGACTGTARACRGWCDTDASDACDNTFTWNTLLLDLFSTQGALTTCYGDVCSAMVTYYDSNRGDDPEDNPYAEADAIGPACKSFLDVAWFTANGTCLTMREFQLESDWDDDISTYNKAFHTCEYTWNCAQYNNTWLALKWAD